MKQLFIFVFLFLGLITTAQNNENAITVETKITDVTVFLSGAQITRKATTTLKKGDNVLHFKDIAYNIDPNSIQIKGDNNFTIVSVTHKHNYVAELKESNEIVDLKSKKEALQFKLELRKNVKSVYEDERSLIYSNQNVKGKNSGTDAEDVIDLADYYRERLTKVELKILELRKEEGKILKEIAQIDNQLYEWDAQKNRPSSEVLVKVSATGKGSSAISLNYMARNASWKPFYDVRSKDSGDKIGLTYKGNVINNTGNDWNNVNITLSTGNPTVSGSKPDFNQWNISVSNKPGKKRKAKAKFGKGVAESYSGASQQSNSYSNSRSSANYTTAVESSTSTNFTIALPYNIPSNGKKIAIEVQEIDLSAGYHFYAAPRYEQNAFLLADVTGWDTYYLLPGEANIYNKGTFVGNSYLNTKTTEDTLGVSLGRDNAIVLDRKKVNDLCKTSYVGSNKKTDIAIEITLRNTKSTPVKITLEDQIPVSSYKVISVENKVYGNAIYDEDTGILTWELTLQPGETKSVQFSYAVKYPKTKTISNL